MPLKDSSILTVNGGSSSLKFKLFDHQSSGTLVASVRGKIERIGLPDSTFTVVREDGSKPEKTKVAVPDLASAVSVLETWLRKELGDKTIGTIVHRIVHGGPNYHVTQKITADLLAELKRIRFLDPDHLPGEISLIEGFQEKRPDATHIACFDTHFHHDMPRVAQMIAIPRRYESQGIRRYGFHGLSYAYVIEKLAEVTTRTVADTGRVIIAHLGAGASVAAVRNGRSIDTTMGLTPTSGLVMATRTGDIDPSLPLFLSRTEQMTDDQFQEMVNHQSGLLGVSETTPDFRELLALENSDPRAAEALGLFVYHAKKAIGSLAAALGGLDTVVFTGGIGENSSQARQRICTGLDVLGIVLDPDRNAAGGPVISGDHAKVTVRVIPTDEESMMARSAVRLLGGS